MTRSEDEWVEEVVALDGLDVVVRRPHDVEALIDEEAFAKDEALPYWAELWPSGVALARALGKRALSGRRVLELGCGLAVPSITAALGGAKVLATDWNEDALAAVEGNARRNGTAVETLRLDWREPDAVLDRPWDHVVAADVLYERRLVPVLLDLLPRLDAPVLIADPGRATAEPFVALATQEFQLKTRRDPVHEQVRLHSLTPRPSGTLGGP